MLFRLSRQAQCESVQKRVRILRRALFVFLRLTLELFVGLLARFRIHQTMPLDDRSLRVRRPHLHDQPLIAPAAVLPMSVPHPRLVSVRDHGVEHDEAHRRLAAVLLDLARLVEHAMSDVIVEAAAGLPFRAEAPELVRLSDAVQLAVYWIAIVALHDAVMLRAAALVIIDAALRGAEPFRVLHDVLPLRR